MFEEITLQNFINKMLYYLYAIIYNTFIARPRSPAVELETSSNWEWFCKWAENKSHIDLLLLKPGIIPTHSLQTNPYNLLTLPNYY